MPCITTGSCMNVDAFLKSSEENREATKRDNPTDSLWQLHPFSTCKNDYSSRQKFWGDQ
jgi:hypothetical protein